MKFQYKTIKQTLAGEPEYLGEDIDTVHLVEKRISELGSQGYRVICASFSDRGNLQSVIMEKISTTFGCTTCKEEQPKEQ